MQPGTGADGSLETGVASDGVLGVVETGKLATVRLGGRPEVPDARPALAGDERPPLTLVEGPVPDLGRRRIADVRSLEEQDGAQTVGLELLPHPAQAVITQTR